MSVTFNLVPYCQLLSQSLICQLLRNFIEKIHPFLCSFKPTLSKISSVEPIEASSDKVTAAIKSEDSVSSKEKTEQPKATAGSGSKAVTSGPSQKIIILATQPASKSSGITSEYPPSSIPTSQSDSTTVSSSVSSTKSVVIKSSSHGQTLPTTGTSFVSSITTDSLQGITYVTISLGITLVCKCVLNRFVVNEVLERSDRGV